MVVFERETRIHAPLDEVWAFHSTVEGLVRLTPDRLGMRVERVWRPGGEELERDATLEAGTLLRLSVQPLGAGPRVEWVSQITAREERADETFFRDEMRQGPFRRWHHTHSFFADGDATIVRDHVEYATSLGQVADEAARVGLAAAFRDRHRRTKRALEKGGRTRAPRQ
jgi:ligand-binding SRPBCC domain-containing protein